MAVGGVGASSSSYIPNVMGDVGGTVLTETVFTIPGFGKLVVDAVFNRDVLNIWLTLWGEIANNPVLQDEHRRQYGRYRDDVTNALLEAAAGKAVDCDALARQLICLIDGLGLQHCIEPALMPPEEAKAACYALLAPHLGPLDP